MGNWGTDLLRVWWGAFVAIAFCAAYLLRGPGILLGHLLVAIAVVAVDVSWIQAEMHRPGWNGQPDQDFVFMVGVLIRILLVNTALLPVGFLALRLRGWRAARGKDGAIEVR